MAATDAGTAATTEHRERVAAVRAATLAQIVRTWPLIDTADIDATSDHWYEVASRIVLAGRNQTTTEAAEYVRAFSVAEAGYEIMAVPAAPLDDVRLRARLYGAGPWTMKRRIGQGRTLTQAKADALATLAGEVTRTVVEGSRDTVLETARAKAMRWQRITDGDPCAFCALLASRGAVYRTHESSHFAAHRDCGCTAELVMRNSGFQTAESKRWKGLYDRSIAEYRAAPDPSLNSDPLNIFRRAYEAQR